MSTRTSQTPSPTSSRGRRHRALVGDASRTGALWSAVVRMAVIGVVWLIGWPIWVTIRERSQPAGNRGSG